MASSVEDAPLASGSLAGSEEVLILPTEHRGGSNSRALKIAGLTTLACLLVASQVFTAYMVFDQKQQIHFLQKNTDRMSRQLTRSSQAVAPMKMRMPMNSLPLLMDFTSDQDTTPTKSPLTKVKETIASVQRQLRELMQDSQLPQFNETFLANLENLKQHVNESEWKMAQQKPAPPADEPASVIKTKCQMEAGPSKVGSYTPQCDEQGHYKPMQCWHATGYCWCVDETGKIMEGTVKRGRPDCQRGE